MRHVFVLEGTAPKPAASSFTCWERRRPYSVCSFPFFKPSSANSCFPHNHTQLLGFRPPEPPSKARLGRAPASRAASGPQEFSATANPATSASRGRAPRVSGRTGVGVGLMEPWRKWRGRQATRGLRPPRPAARALGADHSARASSERPGLSYAMRWKRPVRAAVPRDVPVATEMTSDPGASLGGGGLGGLRSRCYGNHVAGSGGAGDTGHACQTGRLTPARVFAGYPGTGYHARVPVRPRSRRTAGECGPSAQVAAFTRGARAFRGKGAGRQEGANLLAEAPKFRSGRG